jgi:Na+-transporting NADH:ubiquinone oxidoreductase subunit NqrB
MREKAIDPRLYQIASLTLLLGFGMTRLGFDITPVRAVLILGTTLATQYLFTRALSLPHLDFRSPLISGLSLCLLLRTNDPSIAVLATAATISSKFLLRVRGKHLFNPTNFGLVAMMLLTDRVWVSPGQWGSVAFFAFLFACAGGLVVNRASRSDVTYTFIAAYTALLFSRSLLLGEPLTIPLHRLQSGAFLLFAFFMISDPKTTPDSRTGRILFAIFVAWGALTIQFHYFRTNGLLWSLAVFSTAVPLVDLLLPGRRYAWTAAPEQIAPPAAILTHPRFERSAS